MQPEPPGRPDAVSEKDGGSKKPVAEQVTVASRTTLKEALRAAFSRWWGPGPAGQGARSSDELAKDRTEMAAIRTLMAADRTLMAWVRTSLSLNSFGFTIYKVLQGLAEAGTTLPHGHTPRDVGLTLTALGTVSMVMGTVEYAQALRDLHAQIDVKLTRPAFIMALLMCVLGVSLFVNIVTKF